MGLRLIQPFGKPAPYQLEIESGVVRPNHRKGMSSGGHNGIVVEVFEILPRCLASLDDDV